MILVDTGPLVAAANRTDALHAAAAALVTRRHVIHCPISWHAVSAR
jgi:predicted nucleic acid-binding protein